MILQTFANVDYILNNLISGQSFIVKTPAVDVKVSKVSIINLSSISMQYDNEKDFKKSKRKVKVRYLQNNNEEEFTRGLSSKNKIVKNIIDKYKKENDKKSEREILFRYNPEINFNKKILNQSK